MSNIAGPFDHDDWYLLKQLRGSALEMKQKDYNKYRLPIEKTMDTFKYILSRQYQVDNERLTDECA